MDERSKQEIGTAIGTVIDNVVEARRRVSISGPALEQFNRDLIAAGLCPGAIADAYPITMMLGVWIGRQFRDGVPLELAIAQLDEVAGTGDIDTLLEEYPEREDRVLLVMLSAALTALELCCLPGRVVEAATFIIKTTSLAATQTLEQHLPRA